MSPRMGYSVRDVGELATFKLAFYHILRRINIYGTESCRLY